MTRRERIIKKLVAFSVSMLYHRVEVREPPGLTSHGAQLANASHFGGFTDPILLIYAMDRVPRFIARDVIWKFPVVRNLLDWAGAIPVHKSDDGGPTSNDQMFESTYAALRGGDIVTIFPEGITVDDPRIAAIKTGSARIALGARASGVSGITLISAGIHYQNKAVLRSEVFIDIGYSLDLDGWVSDNIPGGAPQDASNREAVHALTAEMESRLRWAAPDFDDWTTSRYLTAAADVALRPADGSQLEVGHGDKERLARLVERSSDALRGRVVETMETYQNMLYALGYGDEAFVSNFQSRRTFAWDVVRQLLIGLLLLPMAVVGIVINTIPMAVVWLIGRLKVADAMMATIKVIGAIFAFVVTWSVCLWWVFFRAGGFSGGGLADVAISVVLLPIYLFAVIALFERLVLLARAVKSLVRSRSIADVHDQLSEHRISVVEAVAQAV